MEIKFAKKDFWLAILAGEASAWLSLPILKNLKVFDILAHRGIEATSFYVFWILFIPAGAVLALNSLYFGAKYKNRLGFFQLGKYGIIGVLNTTLNAGIYNFLIFITNIALGLTVDLFFIIAFIVTVINSFFWNRYWAFEKTGKETVGRDALQFFFVSTVVAILNTGLLHLIINIIGAPMGMEPKIWANVALIFTIIVAFFGNFFGYKFIVFKK